MTMRGGRSDVRVALLLAGHTDFEPDAVAGRRFNRQVAADVPHALLDDARPLMRGIEVGKRARTDEAKRPPVVGDDEGPVAVPGAELDVDARGVRVLADVAQRFLQRSSELARHP